VKNKLYLLLVAIVLVGLLIGCIDTPQMTKDEARNYIASYLTYHLPALTDLSDIYPDIASRRITSFPGAVVGLTYEGSGKWHFITSATVWRGQLPSSGGYDLAIRGKFNERTGQIEVTSTKVMMIH